MNKFQEALKDLEFVLNDYTPEWRLYSHMFVLHKSITELVSRATPLPGKMIAMDGILADIASCLCCQHCEKPIVNVWNIDKYEPNFCHYCGQALREVKDE
jgi:hypothetical protein